MSSSRSSDRALKSVVIISDTNDSQAFCSGCVLSKDATRVVVVCPTQFIKDRRQMLQVSFSDGKKLPATVLTEHGNFCLLGTPKHEDCVGITWSQESLDPDTVIFMFVPTSSKKTERKDAYLAVESVQAYLCEAVDSMEPKSDDYFMVLCDYFVENLGGGNRLAAAPVFTMSGNVLGLVLQNCRPGKTGEVVIGAKMKVVMKASAVKSLLES